MRRTALLTAFWFTLYAGIAARAGTITCSATCLSKLASAVSIAANGKTIVSAAKKIRHPKAKAAKKT